MHRICGVFCFPGEGERYGVPYGHKRLRRGFFENGKNAYFMSLIAACAAAKRAMGTRKGEQDT